jgi:hypothetical protein
MLYVQYALSEKFQNLLYGHDNDIETSTTQFLGLNNYLNIYWKDFYDQIFNIGTANDTGLDIWGQLLNTGRQYYLPTQEKTFGFNVNPGNITDYAQNFEHGSFYNGGNYQVLEQFQYRCLLILRARTFISNGSILSITKILNDFFSNLKNYKPSSINEDYDISVSVNTDLNIPYQVNYTFHHNTTPSTSLPIWLATIFSPGNTDYLPIPIGGFPNIIIE